MTIVETRADTRAITGGVEARACQWPTTVQLNGCSGTLVHPMVVVTASHCGTEHKTAIFGETSAATGMRLVDSRTIEGDVLFLTYEVVRRR